jgi:SAM-dependent methyltransferase
MAHPKIRSLDENPPLGSGKKRKGRKKKRAGGGRPDRHRLYEWSVQNADYEVEFIDKVFRRQRGRRPLRLREDFCGTALLSAEWVKSRGDREAVGLDLDRETLAWANRYNLSALDGAVERIKLLERDVRAVTRPRCDVVCAFNFSYYLLNPLPTLVEYFQQVRRSLRKDGMVFLDCYGGWESQQLLEEPREIEGPEGTFTYVWDQAGFNPIDNMATCYIHFEVPGRKRIKKAFTYHWRLYSIPEVRDALAMAGFTASHVYWDRSEDEDVDDYRKARKAANTPGWLAYIIGEK